MIERKNLLKGLKIIRINNRKTGIRLRKSRLSKKCWQIITLFLLQVPVRMLIKSQLLLVMPIIKRQLKGTVDQLKIKFHLLLNMIATILIKLFIKNN